MKKYTLSLCSFFVFFLLTSQSKALPRFALLRGDASCIGCHVNPTGGQLRSPGGIAFAINDLPMWRRGDSIKYTGEITPGVRLGGDFRSQVLYFSNTSPLYTSVVTKSSDSGGEKTTLVKNGDKTTKTFALHAMSLPFYLDIQATNTLHGFMRFDPLLVGTASAASEGWAMLHFVHSSGEIFKSTDAVTNAYIKVGSFLPAFGIRFDDHTTYVNGGTASLSGFTKVGFWWTPGYRDVGGEIGALFFDHLGVTAGVFDGNESFPPSTFSVDSHSKAFCFRANYATEFIEDMFSGEIGFSRYMHPNHIDQNANTSNLGLNAAHLSLRVGPVTLLNEYDFGTNVIISGGATVAKANALCSEAAFHLAKGFDFMLRYETFKAQDSVGGLISEAKSRIMVGAQWFPLRFLEIRPEYRIAKTSAPNPNDARIADDFTEDTFLLQTHVFF